MIPPNVPKERKEEYELASKTQENLEKKYKGMKLLFHGTSIQNAESMMKNIAKRVSNLEQAESLCQTFGTSLDQVRQDPGSYDFFTSFVFGKFEDKNRDGELYTATRFYRAADYAYRGPEWKYHLLIYFACKNLGIEFNFIHHIPELEDWISQYRDQPAVVVLDATNYSKYPEEDDFAKKYTLGHTAVLDFPIPAEIEVLEVLEWNRPISF